MESIDKDIWQKCCEFSRRLAGVSQELDLSFATTPLNRSEEKEKFFCSFKRGKEYNPAFIYPEPKVNTFNPEKKIETVFFEREIRSVKEIGLFQILEKLRGHLHKKIKLLRAIGTPEFSRHSVSLYGKPDQSCLRIARRILQGKTVECGETVTAGEIKEALEEEIRDFFLDWKVRIVDNITTKVSVSPFNKEVLVNGRLKFTSFEAERLKVHEIDIHVLRAENGSRQPLAIFQTGLDGYQETEEGLGVYFEEKTGNLDKFQEKLYAARALGAALALEGSFFFVFNELSRYLPAELAYRITERVKRGISDTAQRGGFSKDYCYISGREKIREYVGRGGDIRILFVGKIGLEDIGLAEKLLDEAILKKPAIIPEFIRPFLNKK